MSLSITGVRGMSAVHSFLAPIGMRLAYPEGVVSAAKRAMSDGSATRVTDPELLEKLNAACEESPGYDITAPKMCDNQQTVFIVGGRTYVRIIGFGGPRHAMWYEVSPDQFLRSARPN